MNNDHDLSSIAGMDIYLIDQIMKGRYLPGQYILDAGAGKGRNLNWFFAHDFKVSACDLVSDREGFIHERFPEATFDWKTCEVSDLPYRDGTFDHIICNAVMHFARDRAHFMRMLGELARVLKVGGSLFIRTSGSMGIEGPLEPLGEGRYRLPDENEFFLVDRRTIAEMHTLQPFDLIESPKYLNVDDQRVMCTVVLRKR